jgi:hypothetical protein
VPFLTGERRSYDLHASGRQVLSDHFREAFGDEKTFGFE